MQSSCHGGQIQLNPSLVSRHIVPDGHGLIEQSSKPNLEKNDSITCINISINFLFFPLSYLPRIELKSPELHKSVEHIHQYWSLYVRQPSTSKSRTHRSSVQRRSVTLREKKRIIRLILRLFQFFLAFIQCKKRKAKALLKAYAWHWHVALLNNIADYSDKIQCID